MGEQSLRLSDGTEVALRHSTRARRMVLRVGRSDGRAVLTLPRGASITQARAFLDERAAWLARHQAAAPGPQWVEAGAMLPVAGQSHRITPVQGLRIARLDGADLLVPSSRPVGAAVAALLRARAQAALAAACARHVAALGRPARDFTGLALRDTRSRWGSCNAAGRLMFSWRLAMTPTEVLDYVAAHEVAHLRHMDHSPAFWGTVTALWPGHEAPRQWLRQHGPGVLAWRFVPA